MAYQISQETINQTRQCTFAFQCLNDDGWGLCSVDRKVEGGGVFIHLKKRDNCRYSMFLGDAYVCNCPTRYELFERYKV